MIYVKLNFLKDLTLRVLNFLEKQFFFLNTFFIFVESFHLRLSYEKFSKIFISQIQIIIIMQFFVYWMDSSVWSLRLSSSSFELFDSVKFNIFSITRSSQILNLSFLTPLEIFSVFHLTLLPNLTVSIVFQGRKHFTDYNQSLFFRKT